MGRRPFDHLALGIERERFGDQAFQAAIHSAANSCANVWSSMRPPRLMARDDEPQHDGILNVAALPAPRPDRPR